MTFKSRKIVFLTNLPAPYRFPIWNRMAEKLDLTVFFTLGENNWRNWPPPIDVKWNFRFLSLKCFRIKEYEFIPRFYGASQILKCTDLVIIGSWDAPVYISTLIQARLKSIPVVMIYESHENSQRFRRGIISVIRSWCYRTADLVVTFGELSTNAIEQMGVLPQNVTTLFNTVPMELYREVAKQRQIDWNIGHKYLFVGQLIERKNIESLLHAFDKIHLESDTLTIVGEGNRRKHLENIALKMGLSNCVNFVGHKSSEELTQLYATHQTLVLPSINEVWGLVVNEALATGMHAVISSKCGVANFVKNMKGCFISEPHEDDLASAMERSRLDWSGFIETPEILEYSPQKFTDLLVQKIVTSFS